LRNLFDRFRSPPRADPASRELKLTGAPSRLRLKTYSSESGCVYQYLYRGQHGEEDATTFVFSVTVNRKDWTPISVVLERQTVEDWQRADGRRLRAADLYAIAKMSLFESFDRSDGAHFPSLIRASADDISRHLDALGLL
jgi:hypothetical protein